MLDVFFSTYAAYLSLARAQEVGRFKTIEGQVQNFHPMPFEGHGYESFEVNGVRFHYSDYEVTAGFNNTASHGGPIRQGLPVRIAYSGNTILRLDVRVDGLPSSSERLEYSKEQKSQWQQRQQDSPILSHMKLGFSIAATVITLLWNIDWRHYMRYWKRSGPPYGRNWEYAFRAFFLLSFGTSAWRLLDQVPEKKRMAQDYGPAILDSLIWIGFFLAADGFFRWWLRRAQRRVSK